MQDVGLQAVIAEIDSRDDSRIEVRVSYSEKDMIRAIPGRIWRDGRWTVPKSWASCVTLRAVFGQRLVVGSDLWKWAEAEKRDRIDPALALREAVDAPGDERLLPFQRAGVKWLEVAESALLGDDMGAGKGVQGAWIIGALRESALPALVIAPKSVMVNWQREIDKWSPGLQVSLVTGTAAKRKKALEPGFDVYVIAWENVRRHSRLAPFGSYKLKHCSVCDPEDTGKQTLCERCPKELNNLGFRTVIADEVHRMKDPASKQTRAVWAVQHGPSVIHRWSLTGTPIANNPADIWPIMHGIAPEDWPSRTQHLDRFCNLTLNIFGGLEISGIKPETRDEFFRILDTRFRRMPKDLVLPHLPPKLYQERLIALSKEQQTAYNQMADSLMADIDGGRLVAISPLAQLTRLMQFASATCFLQEDGSVRMTEPSCKIDELVAIIEELGDEPFVVSAESRLLIELTSKRLTDLKVGHSLIVGGQSNEERQQSVDDFQDGRVRACLFTLKAGGVGLTLARGGYLIRLQRSYNAIDNRQAEDRVHRIGSEQHDKILIIDLVSEGTIEETSQKMQLFDKAEQFEAVVRDRDLLRRLVKR